MRFDRRSASYFLLGDCCPMMEDNSAHFFEGTEKLLEVWFSRQDETKGTGDLRTIPRLVSLPSPFAFWPRQVSLPAAGCPPPSPSRVESSPSRVEPRAWRHCVTSFNTRQHALTPQTVCGAFMSPHRQAFRPTSLTGWTSAG